MTMQVPGRPSTSAATQAQMEAASSSAVMVTPAVVKYHPGVAKAWVTFTGTGTIAVRGGYNIASLTDNGVGDYTVNFTTAFSATTSMCPVASMSFNDNATYNPRVAEVIIVNTTSVRLVCGSETGGVDDQASVYMAVYGDQ